MTCRELITKAEAQNRELLERGKAAAAKLDDENWNLAPPGGWSPAQIFEHLILSNQDHLAIISSRLSSAPKGGEAQVRHTLFGKVILKSAGPEGKGPVPKPFVPKPGPYTREVFSRWEAQQEQIILLHDKVRDVDLPALRYPVPLMKLFKMSFCDIFAIFAAHTERHIRQIEERARAQK